MSTAVQSPVERAQAELDVVDRLLAGESEEEATKQEDVEAKGESEPQKQEEEVVEKEEQKDEVDYKQKWLSFEGMYSKAMRQIDELKNENSTLKNRIDALAIAKTVNQPSGNTLTDGATKTEMAEHLKSIATEYGDEFADVLGSFVKGIAGERVSGLEGKMQDLTDRIESVSSNSEADRRERFRSDLTSRVDDWEEIFQSNDFAMWLENSTETLTGRTYSDIFSEANNSWDLDRMVRFFKAYKKETGKVQSESENKEPKAKKQNIAPKNTGGSSNQPEKEPAKIIWNAEKISAFYEAERRGEFIGKEEERDALERSIFESSQR